ncbi:ABC transporter permease [Aurantivibrio plasticivorans]
MALINLNPQTQKTFNRFRSIGRGYWSAIILLVLILLSLVTELLINSRALIVSYEGEWYFPTYGAVIPGETFGLDYQYETNYRDLQKQFKAQGEDSSGNKNWVLMPIVPYNAFENDFIEGSYPPYAPSITTQHYLGTDTVGRDILARLVYGFRIAIFFSLFLLLCNYSVGVAIGCLMGYWGGAFDLLFQRLIEIWSNIPFLYVIMIIASIIVPSFWTLILVMVMFSWMGMTWYMRTATYKEKSREYVLAAKALGAGTSRVVFRHILPNTVSVIITFIPFSVAGGITALTSLDFLGFGLPPPTPSWGELLSQGIANLQSPWIVSSVVTSLIVILTMVTFVGEAIREAFDPKRHTIYE